MRATLAITLICMTLALLFLEQSQGQKTDFDGEYFDPIEGKTTKYLFMDDLIN